MAPPKKPIWYLTEFSVESAATPSAATPLKRRKTLSAHDPNHSITQPTGHRSNVAAQDAVLSTFELVERIVSFLLGKNVFGVIRVSKTFKSIVERSPALKYKLFFGPKPQAGNGGSSTTYKNQRLIPRNLLSNHRGVSRPTQHVFLNPRLEGYLQPRYAREEPCYHEEIVSFVLEDLVPRDPATGDLTARGNDFLETYLTDPPCQAFYVEINADYTLPAAVGLWPNRTMTYSLCRGSTSGINETQIGPTIGDLVTAASRLRHELYYEWNKVAARSNPNGIDPIKTEQWHVARGLPCHVPMEASLDEALDLLRAAETTHAAAILNPRTHVTLRMLHTIVWRPEGLPMLPGPASDGTDSEPDSDEEE